MEDRDFLGLYRYHLLEILQNPFHEKKVAVHQLVTTALEQLRIYNDVADSGFIFKADEYESLSGSWSLPCDHRAGNPNGFPIPDFLET